MKYICNNCNEEYPYEPVYCNECGTIYSIATFHARKEDREIAIQWWKNLSEETRISITKHTRLTTGSLLVGENLTGREIENLWREHKNLQHGN